MNQHLTTVCIGMCTLLMLSACCIPQLKKKELEITWYTPEFSIQIEPEKFREGDSITVTARMYVKDERPEDYNLYWFNTFCTGWWRGKMIKKTRHELIAKLPMDAMEYCNYNRMELLVGGKLEIPEQKLTMYYEQEYRLFPVDSPYFSFQPYPDSLIVSYREHFF